MVTGNYDLVSWPLYIPCISRVYYTRRSQPPVFAQLVQDYLTWTNDLTTERQFIAGVVWHLDQEFQFWQSTMVNVSVGAETHQLARYWVDVGGPRPGQSSASFAAEQFVMLILIESYREDYSLGQNFGTNESNGTSNRDLWYRHIKSGAESGQYAFP